MPRTVPTILVIDDAPDVHDLLDEHLSPDGWMLYHNRSGRAGLDTAVRLQPDLILLDSAMPDMSGFAICRRLKDDAATAHIPVLFLGETGLVQDKVRAFDLGAVDYVTKPFQVEELRARVRSALRTKRYQDMLAERARIDGLTGLWNRAHFDARLIAEVAAVRRYGRRLSLLLVDIDHFKRVNDEFGHPFGDTVLQAVGEMLQRNAREADAPCRYGGEEFAILLTETGGDHAAAVAERLRASIAGLAWTAREQQVSITVSVGVASADFIPPGEPVTPERLLADADAALYTAKRLGRDRVCRADEGCADAAPSPPAPVRRAPSPSPREG